MRRLRRPFRWPGRAWHGQAMPQGWRTHPAPGINVAPPGVSFAVPELPVPVTYPLGLDIGEVADGCHLIVTSIGLTSERLLFDFEFAPEDAGKGLWPSMEYGADVAPPGWNNACTDGEEYERPVPQATYAWFDFYRCDYEPLGRSDSENRQHRIARLTFHLKTGQAQIQH